MVIKEQTFPSEQMDIFEIEIITIQLIYWFNKITKGVWTMTIFILRTTVFWIALILSLFSEKLFKQHEKIGKIICTIIILVAVLLMMF